SNCLSCKGCTPECPSNVNLALLKAELLYAAIRKHGLGLPERILSRPDLLGQIGCAFPRMANAALEFAPLRTLMEKTIGLSAKRSLPKYASKRFDRWFAKRAGAGVGDPGSELQYANHLPRAFLLLDVRGRLSRVENSGRRINRSTQFSLRKICERHSGRRTDEAAISRAR